MSGVALTDRWRTPHGVVLGALQLLGRKAFDLDAAAEEGAAWAPNFISAEEDALVVPWGPRCPTWRPRLALAGRLDELPAVWLNSPFSEEGGGKDVWIDRAADQARTGLLVSIYLPSYADKGVSALDGRALARMGVVGRVAHIPPPELPNGHPDRHAHAVHLLGPSWLAWPGPTLCAWDWRAQAWVGRTPLLRGAVRSRAGRIKRLGSGLVSVGLWDDEATAAGFRELHAMGPASLSETLPPIWATAPAAALADVARALPEPPTHIWSTPLC